MAKICACRQTEAHDSNLFTTRHKRSSRRGLSGRQQGFPAEDHKAVSIINTAIRRVNGNFLNQILIHGNRIKSAKRLQIKHIEVRILRVGDETYALMPEKEHPEIVLGANRKVLRNALLDFVKHRGPRVVQDL